MGTQFFSTMKEKAVQIPLGIDIQYFQPVTKIFNSLDGIEIKKDDFVIVSVANLVPVKGIEVLLNAVKKINDNSVKTFIIGANDNKYGQVLQKQFQDKNIYFLGRKIDVRPYLGMADVFVIPTKDEGRKEGMPIAPLEAMAMGKVVLGSKTSGITDILNEFQDNLFEPDNVEELMSKILKIKNLEINKRQILEDNIRNYVVDNLCLNNFILNHEKLYFNLIK